MPITARQVEQAYKAILTAALAGTRCPQDARYGHSGLPSGATTKLVHDGRLKIEVYGKNWRVAEIVGGEHAGKRTQEPPFQNAGPYLVRDASGSHRCDHIARAVSRRRGAPSAPRPLSPRELRERS